MSTLFPSFREAGAGPGVVCLHADAGSSSQWRGLMEMGRGAWDQTPEQRKGPITTAIENVVGWGDALFKEPTPLEAFATLDVPVLYMMGGRSPASSRSVARLLTRVLPRVEVVEFAELGHMGPVTHPNIVNAAISGFLART